LKIGLYEFKIASYTIYKVQRLRGSPVKFAALSSKKNLTPMKQIKRFHPSTISRTYPRGIGFAFHRAGGVNWAGGVNRVHWFRISEKQKM